MRGLTANEEGYDAGRYWLEKGDHEKAAVWRKVFMIYCDGELTLEQIVEQFGISKYTLADKISRDGWTAVRANRAVVKADRELAVIEYAEQRLARVKANRERSYKEIAELRDVALDLVNITNVLKSVQEMAYRALGDAVPKNDPTQAGTAGDGNRNSTAGITVILPAVAVEPRTPPRELSQPVVDIETTRSTDTAGPNDDDLNKLPKGDAGPEGQEALTIGGTPSRCIGGTPTTDDQPSPIASAAQPTIEPPPLPADLSPTVAFPPSEPAS